MTLALLAKIAAGDAAADGVSASVTRGSMPLDGRDAQPTVSLAHKDAAFTEFFRQTNGWVAGDVATSIALSDGRVLWLFGDSYVDDFDAATGTVPCLFDARNAVMLQNANSLAHLHTLLNSRSGDKSFFYLPAARPGELWPCFWPGAGFQDGQNVYVYLTEMQKTPLGGMWGFKAIGQYWAKLAFPELKVSGYVKLPDFNGINFGCGFVEDHRNGFTYAFGYKQRFIGSDVYLARFPTKHPAGRWSFWDGTNWTVSVTNAAVIAQGTSTSVNVCKVRDKYLLTTTAFSVACDQGRDIYISVSGSPTGPFSPRLTVFAVDDTVDGHQPFFYSAVAHPEFVNARNELLVTYCINGYEPCLPSCVNGRLIPDYYRPRALDVPFSRIDSDFKGTNF